MTLDKFCCNQKCLIKKLPKIKLLNFLGVREGISISIKSVQPFGGPIVIRVGNRDVAISKEIAEQIEVKEVI